ncbi:MAG: DUF1015 domain-containing protein [Oscillospiraceae bacterium]|nr:DUF1015 domain-containing protein [Oscillospiraceae bacterium]
MTQHIFSSAEIFLPDWNQVCPETWSVIACDQFTSSPEYWKQAEMLAGNAPSALHLILPELYLEQPNLHDRICKIHDTMKQYLEQGLLKAYDNAMIYTERIQSNGIIRTGIIGKIDLEAYDYHAGSQSPVRATEATVLERIPPRMKVREDALLELPHIMILINDEQKHVIEACGAQKQEMQLLYDTDLMLGGGHVSGWLMNDVQQNAFQERLQKLLNHAGNLRFAMGDGNHSLATAKACYEKLKQEHPEQDFSQHPARYALAELVNLHSPALEFEAIHRIVTETNPAHLLEYLIQKLELSEIPSEQEIVILQGTEQKKYYIHKPCSALAVGSLQMQLDNYLKQYSGKIDYIHGIQTVTQLAQKPDSIGFLLPDMNKNLLFSGVEKDGVLPRKTFSTGHAEDKRYYMEARKIR